MTLETPELTIAAFAVLGITIAAIAYFIQWLFAGPVSPDPWDESIEAAVRDGDAQPVCHRCFIEHAETTCFCPQCGAAVGEYNNYLPFEYLFSEGEALRNGTQLRHRKGFLVVGGYLLFSAAVYTVFAPVYWLFLFRNLLKPAPLEESPPLAVPPSVS